jgi:hypothetical protein
MLVSGVEKELGVGRRLGKPLCRLDVLREPRVVLLGVHLDRDAVGPRLPELGNR